MENPLQVTRDPIDATPNEDAGGSPAGGTGVLCVVVSDSLAGEAVTLDDPALLGTP